MIGPQIGSTFIPKKPAMPAREGEGSHIGFFLLLSLVVFFVSLAFYGGSYYYKLELFKQRDNLDASLASEQKAFDPAKLADITRTDEKIKIADDLLKSHVAVIPLFRLLESYTLGSVRFRSFSFSTKEKGAVEINASGEAKNYASIALQSDAFTESIKLKDVVFSGLSLSELGRVNFQMKAAVDPSVFSYLKANRRVEDEQSIEEKVAP